MPCLVIFDCDGVLIDSEPLASRSMSEVLVEFGISMPVEQINAELVGISLQGVTEYVWDRFGVELEADFWEAHLRKTLDLFSAELKPIDYVPEMLDQVPDPKCVASSGRMARLRPALEMTNLVQRFDPHIYNSEMVERAKPAPDLFLHVAEKMGFHPADCLVIEDSKVGVTAAVAAGMEVIGFTGGSHTRSGHGEMLVATGAGLIFEDMRELPGILRARAEILTPIKL